MKKRIHPRWKDQLPSWDGWAEANQRYQDEHANDFLAAMQARKEWREYGGVDEGFDEEYLEGLEEYLANMGWD